MSTEPAPQLFRPEDIEPTPGPSNFTLSLSKDDTTQWTDPLDGLVPASLFSSMNSGLYTPQTSFLNYGYSHPQYGMTSYETQNLMLASSSRLQTYSLPNTSSTSTPNPNYFGQFASSSMHNIHGKNEGRSQHEFGLLSMGGVLPQATLVDPSHITQESHYWSPPSSSSRQIGNIPEESDESRRKGHKRECEETEKWDGEYRRQYRHIFDDRTQ